MTARVWVSTNDNAFFSDNDDDCVCLSTIYNKRLLKYQNTNNEHFLASVNPLNVAFWQAISTANSLQTT